MSSHKSRFAPHNFRINCDIFCLATLLCLVDNPQRIATQRLSSLDGYTPPWMAKGPEETYALSGFDNVSYATGSLNFRLQVTGIGGRGSTGYTMFLPIETKWHVESERVQEGTCYPSNICNYTYRYTGNGGVADLSFSPSGLTMRQAGQLNTASCQPQQTPNYNANQGLNLSK